MSRTRSFPTIIQLPDRLVRELNADNEAPPEGVTASPDLTNQSDSQNTVPQDPSSRPRYSRSILPLVPLSEAIFDPAKSPKEMSDLRLRLALSCKPKYRMMVDAFVLTRSPKRAARAAGFNSKDAAAKGYFFQLIKRPEVAAYLQFLETKRKYDPDLEWICDVLKVEAEGRGPDTSSAARRQAAMDLATLKGFIKKDKDENRTVVHTKVIIGVDPKLI